MHMRNGLLLGAVLVLLAGCTSQDENKTWNPSTNYPDWAYNAPVYYQPVEELTPKAKVGNNIPVYYTRDALFFIKHPQGQQADIQPHVAVYGSDNGGQDWAKSGYYGLEQTHFLYKAPHDGGYWIRFVGRGQGIAEVPPGQPHRIYVVDTKAPAIELSVYPAPWVCQEQHDKETTAPGQQRCCEKCRRRVYHVGETIILNWTVHDPNLKPNTIRLSTCFAKFPHNLVWSRFEDDLPAQGAMEVTIPSEAVHQAGLRFRVTAEDLADNIGLGMSDVLRVQPGREPADLPGDPQPEHGQPLSPVSQAPEPAPLPERMATPATDKPAWDPAQSDPEDQSVSATEPMPERISNDQPPAEPTQPAETTLTADGPARDAEPIARPSETVETPAEPAEPAETPAPAEPEEQLASAVDEKPTWQGEANTDQPTPAEDAKPLQRPTATPQPRDASPVGDVRDEELLAVRQVETRPSGSVTADTSDLADQATPASRPRSSVTPPAGLLDPISITGNKPSAPADQPQDGLVGVLSEIEASAADPQETTPPSAVADETPADTPSPVARESEPTPGETPDVATDEVPAEPSRDETSVEAEPSLPQTVSPPAVAEIEPLQPDTSSPSDESTPTITAVEPVEPSEPTPIRDELAQGEPANTPSQATNADEPLTASQFQLYDEPSDPADQPIETTHRTPDMTPSAVDQGQPVDPVAAITTDSDPIEEVDQFEQKLQQVESMDAPPQSVEPTEPRARAEQLAPIQPEATEISEPAAPTGELARRDEKPLLPKVSRILRDDPKPPAPGRSIVPARPESPATNRVRWIDPDGSEPKAEVDPSRISKLPDSPQPPEPARSVQPKLVTVLESDKPSEPEESQSEFKLYETPAETETTPADAVPAESPEPLLADATAELDASQDEPVEAPQPVATVEPTAPAPAFEPETTAEPVQPDGEQIALAEPTEPLSDLRAELEKIEFTPQPQRPVSQPAEGEAPDREVSSLSRAIQDGPRPADVTLMSPTEQTKDEGMVGINPADQTPERPTSVDKPTSLMDLDAIPEKVQQGWPSEGMVLRGGVSRLLNWLPANAEGYKMLELQFTANNGQKWVTVATGLKRGRAVMWSVPVVTSEHCRLRVVGFDEKGGKYILETSEPFTVDTGAWKTIDMSRFKARMK